MTRTLNYVDNIAKRKQKYFVFIPNLKAKLRRRWNIKEPTTKTEVE